MGKGALIWRRTWVGLLLTGVVTALLVGAGHRSGGILVWVVGGLAMVGCCAEAGGLGRFARRGLRAPLLAAGSVLMAALASDLAAGAPALHLGWRYAEAVCLALLVGALGARWGPARAPGAALVPLVTALLAGSWHLARPAAVDPRWGVLAMALLAVLTVAAAARDPRQRSRLALLGFLALWLVPPLPGLLHVWWLYGAGGLAGLVILSKSGDVFGYYVGNALGRSHPFPRTSPGKTTAGCVGSLLGTVAVGGALVPLGLLPAGVLGWLGGLLAGAVVNLAAQAGDLLESAFKRRAGVKDSGSSFGPAGGVLDLFDSLLLSIPVALLCWPWILGSP